jgi:hypothetical protein
MRRHSPFDEPIQVFRPALDGMEQCPCFQVRPAKCPALRHRFGFFHRGGRSSIASKTMPLLDDSIEWNLIWCDAERLRQQSGVDQSTIGRE